MTSVKINKFLQKWENNMLKAKTWNFLKLQLKLQILLIMLFLVWPGSWWAREIRLMLSPNNHKEVVVCRDVNREVELNLISLNRENLRKNQDVVEKKCTLKSFFLLKKAHYVLLVWILIFFKYFFYIIVWQRFFALFLSNKVQKILFFFLFVSWFLIIIY
jgi:hypothetical protein